MNVRRAIPFLLFALMLFPLACSREGVDQNDPISKTPRKPSHMYYTVHQDSGTLVVHNSPLGDHNIPLDPMTTGIFFGKGFTRDRAHSWEFAYAVLKEPVNGKRFVVTELKWNGKEIPEENEGTQDEGSEKGMESQAIPNADQVTLTKSENGTTQDRDPPPASRGNESLSVGVKQGSLLPEPRALLSEEKFVANVGFGDEVTVLQRDAKWFQVRNQHGHEGWIHSSLLCDSAELETRRKRKLIPSGVFLVGGVKNEVTHHLQVLAGGLRDDGFIPGTSLRRVVLEPANCIVFEGDTDLTKIPRIILFAVQEDSPVIEKPQKGVLYYFVADGKFELLPSVRMLPAPAE